MKVEQIIQETLESIFDDYQIIHSEFTCNFRLKGNRRGDRVKCIDGEIRRIVKYFDWRRERIFWCFPDEYEEKEETPLWY